MIDLAPIRARFAAVLSELDERERRLLAAAEARAAGYGGIAAVSEATGLAASTIGRGLRELDEAVLRAPGRVRRPGGGCKPRTEPTRRCSGICWRWSSRTSGAIRCRRCAGPARACA